MYFFIQNVVYMVYSYFLQIYEDCPVIDIHYAHNLLGNKEVTGVHTEKGLIKTKCVVNCGGNDFKFSVQNKFKEY